MRGAAIGLNIVGALLPQVRCPFKGQPGAKCGRTHSQPVKPRRRRANVPIGSKARKTPRYLLIW